MIATLVDREVRAACSALAARLPPAHVIHGQRGPYLSRWTVRDFGSETGAAYLHFFHRGGEDTALHTHPWGWGVALQLAGGYREERLVRGAVVTRTCRPWSLVFLTPKTAHRVDLLDPESGAWSLILVGPKVASWGFVDRVTGDLVPWREHITAKGLVPVSTPRRWSL